MPFNIFSNGYLDEKLEYLWDEFFEYWARSIRISNFPLSGDVTQFIRAWGEMVGQIGLFNFNLPGTGDPKTERRIGQQYSYGRQLGRMLDVLEPLVREHERLIVNRAGRAKFDDFVRMADKINRLKKSPPRNASEVADKVRLWRDDMDPASFQRELYLLIWKLLQLC